MLALGKGRLESHRKTQKMKQSVWWTLPRNPCPWWSPSPSCNDYHSCNKRVVSSGTHWTIQPLFYWSSHLCKKEKTKTPSTNQECCQTPNGLLTHGPLGSLCFFFPGIMWKELYSAQCLVGRACPALQSFSFTSTMLKWEAVATG